MYAISKPRKALSMLLLGIVLGLVAAACSSDDESSAEPTDVDLKLGGVLPESMKFTSGIFANEYLRDTTAADAKFMGKIVELTGVVSTFGTNKDNVAYVNVQGIGGGDSGGAPIQCVFAEPGVKEAFSELRPGLQATLKGTAEGFKETVKDQEGQFALFSALGDIVTLSDCSVVQ